MDGSQKEGDNFLNLLQKEGSTQKEGFPQKRGGAVPTLEETVGSCTERMKLKSQQHHPSSSSTVTNSEGMVSKVYKNFFQ